MLVSAHRGTVKESPFAENALESLKWLHEQGVVFAEIDVARLKDGTHILWHDGVWDRTSTGKGSVAATAWSDASKFLLRDSKGRLTASRPARLDEVLAWAKGRMYLEIDFKTSANPQITIEQIRAAGLIRHVILIANTPEQARKYHDLAPQAFISIGMTSAKDINTLQTKGLPISRIAAWLGDAKEDASFLKMLRSKNIPIIRGSFYGFDARAQQLQDFSVYTSYAGHTDVLVSDAAINAQKALALSKESQQSLAVCLRSRQ